MVPCCPPCLAHRVSLWLTRKMQAAGCLRRLQKANVTRWTSVHTALHVFLQAKKAIQALFAEDDERTQKEKIFSRKTKLDTVRLSPEKWLCLEEVMVSLQKPHEAAVRLQGEAFVTLSEVVPIIQGVKASVERDMYMKPHRTPTYVSLQ
jgi:hypothetical protein